MVIMNLCWLIGHYPIGPIWEHVTKEAKKVYIYKCKRCNSLIVFDSDKRKWIKW